MTENSAQLGVPDLLSRQYLALLDLSKAIASHRDISNLFHDLACRLKSLFEFKYLGVLLHDGTRDVMRSRSWRPANRPYGKPRLRSRSKGR